MTESPSRPQATHLGAGLPLTQRLIARAPLASAWTGLALSSLQFGAFLLFLGFVGGPQEWPGGFFRDVVIPNLVMAFLVGYAPVAMAHTTRASLRELDNLRGSLGVSPAEFEALRREIMTYRRGRLRAAGAVAAVVTPAIVLLDPKIPVRVSPPEPFVAWMLWANGLTGWMLARTALRSLELTSLFAKIGERTRVDLFDLRPLAPFTRRGLHDLALGVAGAWSISLLLLFGGSAVESAPLLALALLGIGALALVLPVRAVHRAIARTKRSELTRLRDAVRTDHARVLESGGEGSARSQQAAQRLPALLHLLAHVESVREWPFDLSTALRFVLYVGLGAGSWLGAALVERALDRFFA